MHTSTFLCSTAAFSFCLSTADIRLLSISTISMAPIVPEARREGKVSDGRVVDESPRHHTYLERSLQGQAQALKCAKGHPGHIGELRWVGLQIGAPSTGQ